MTIFGYARVSTDGQTLASQDAQLHAAGCAKVYSEKVNGARGDRPELAKLRRRLDAGDVLMVTRLDRLARSTRDLEPDRRISRIRLSDKTSRPSPTAGRACSTSCICLAIPTPGGAPAAFCGRDADGYCAVLRCKPCDHWQAAGTSSSIP